LVLLGTIGAPYAAREVLITFAYALTLTFLLTPVVDLLKKLHIGPCPVPPVVSGGIGWIIANQLVEVVNKSLDRSEFGIRRAISFTVWQMQPLPAS
jgi:hypothetical protein